MAALVYLSHAPEDSAHRDVLEKHLAPLVRAGTLSLWHEEKSLPGEDRDKAAAAQLEAAALVLLLISADYLASDRCHSEMTRALRLAQAGGGHVVPVLLRPCLANREALLGLAALPAGGKPITTWISADDAWANVAAHIGAAVEPRAASARGDALPRAFEVSEVREAVARAAPPARARMSGRMRKPLDDETILCLAKLEDARVRKRRLEEGGTGTREVDAEILAFKRQLREGGQVRQGDLLGGRYSLLQHVGRGGFATVWEAEDRLEHKRVALKVLHTNLADDPDRTDRFLRGARVMADLAHEAVVRILDPHVEDGGYCCFAMELIPGGDLQRAVVEGRFPREHVIPLIVRVGDALAFAHARGYIHRDVKPANILLDSDGAPKLTDFDLVGDEDTSGGTRTGAMGTFVYAAPEVLSRPQDADVRADVFGLGMTALFCLHGRKLPDAVFRNPERVLSQAVDKPVGDVLRKAIEWDPADRYATMKELCDALRAARPAPVVLPAPDTLAEASGKLSLRDETAEPSRSKARGRAAAGAASVLLALTLIALTLEATGRLQIGRIFAEPSAALTGDQVPARPEGTTNLPAVLTTAVAASSTAALTPGPPPDLPACPDGMSAVRGGTFSMGSLRSDKEADIDEREHEVTLSSFCIDRTEVTVADYRRCAARAQNGAKCPAVPTTFKSRESVDGVHIRDTWCNGGASDREDHPINCVDWNMADTFCRWAGKRLPSEAQWEYAARGTTGRKYAWGDERPGPQRLNACGPECSDMIAKEGHVELRSLYDETDPWRTTAPAGAVKDDESFFKVHDMGGNVMEWVADWYAPYDTSMKNDPLQNKKPATEPKRGQRGAGWMSYAAARARAAYRFYEPADTRNVNVGFRCALGQNP